MKDNITPMERRKEEQAIVDLRKARNWIARWRKLGGGFQVTDLSVDPVLKEVSGPEAERQQRIARGLMTELQANDVTRGIVYGMVLNAHAQTAAKQSLAAQAAAARDAANDADGEPPEAA